MTSGEDALALVEKTRFDLILLDVIMPTLDGPATLLRLRAQEHGKAIPVVFVTAHTDDNERRRLRALDVLGVFEKPLNPQTITRRIKSLIKQSCQTA